SSTLVRSTYPLPPRCCPKPPGGSECPAGPGRASRWRAPTAELPKARAASAPCIDPLGGEECVPSTITGALYHTSRSPLPAHELMQLLDSPLFNGRHGEAISKRWGVKGPPTTMPRG